MEDCRDSYLYYGIYRMDEYMDTKEAMGVYI